MALRCSCFLRLSASCKQCGLTVTWYITFLEKCDVLRHKKGQDHPVLNTERVGCLASLKSLSIRQRVYDIVNTNILFDREYECTMDEREPERLHKSKRRIRGM